ncbi:MAG: hypothetical protein IPL95_06605 [Saprospiraceae bacterium]|nr:hypothetical protein [Saprospiraceae bacterium]
MPNLKNLEKEVAITYYRKGVELFEKQKVREIDEEGSGNYIAFVDDGKNSFDVQIKINSKTFDITENNCDCSESTPFCQHKVAVSLQIAKKGTIKTKVIANKLKMKKKSKVETLLDNTSELDLRNWVLELFTKDKSIAIQFSQRFEGDNILLDKDAIIQKTNELAKVVLGRKKFIQLSNLIKIFELWKPFHENILNKILPILHEEHKLLILLSLLDTIHEYEYNLDTNSNKFVKYIDLIFEKIENAILVSNEENRYKILSDLIKNIKKINYRTRFLIIILKTIETFPKEKSDKIFFEFMLLFPSVLRFEYSIKKELYITTMKLDKLPSYYDKILPSVHDDEYNTQVVVELIKYKIYDYGITFALEAIKNTDSYKNKIKLYTNIIQIYSELGDKINTNKYQKLFARYI